MNSKVFDIRNLISAVSNTPTKTTQRQMTRTETEARRLSWARGCAGQASAIRETKQMTSLSVDVFDKLNGRQSVDSETLIMSFKEVLKCDS